MSGPLFLTSLFMLHSLFSVSVFAAACCSGGTSSASLLSSDDRLLTSLSWILAETPVDFVNDQGEWFAATEPLRTDTLRFDTAFLLSDRWQLGMGIPLTQKQKGESRSFGVGDSNLLIGYEYLPEWTYHPYLPRGVGYLQLLLPIGRTTEESTQLYQTDAFGKGFWQIGAGTVLSKSRPPWDASVTMEIHSAPPRSIQSADFSGTQKPGWGSQVACGLGYGSPQVALNGSLAWVYEGPQELSGTFSGSTQAKKYVSALLSIKKELTDEPLSSWTLALSYVDQTLFGEPQNTGLEQSWNFTVSRHIHR